LKNEFGVRMQKIPEKEYKFILDNIPICCVDVVIEHNGKFLVCKRKDEPMKDKYWFVGGRLLKGESAFVCAQRKLNDEAGISWSDVGAIFRVDTFETIFDAGPLNTKSHTINITYHALINTIDCVHINNEDFSDYRWANGSENFLDDYIKKVITIATTEIDDV
jgi:colanic acid biosynthesis protein WcaH